MVPGYCPGQKVWLSTSDLPLRVWKQKTHQFVGPFPLPRSWTQWLSAWGSLVPSGFILPSMSPRSSQPFSLILVCFCPISCLFAFLISTLPVCDHGPVFFSRRISMISDPLDWPCSVFWIVDWNLLFGLFIEEDLFGLFIRKGVVESFIRRGIWICVSRINCIWSLFWRGLGNKSYCEAESIHSAQPLRY